MMVALLPAEDWPILTAAMAGNLTNALNTGTDAAPTATINTIGTKSSQDLAAATHDMADGSSQMHAATESDSHFNQTTEPEAAPALGTTDNSGAAVQAPTAAARL